MARRRYKRTETFRFTIKVRGVVQPSDGDALLPELRRIVASNFQVLERLLVEAVRASFLAQIAARWDEADFKLVPAQPKGLTPTQAYALTRSLLRKGEAMADARRAGDYEAVRRLGDESRQLTNAFLAGSSDPKAGEEHGGFSGQQEQVLKLLTGTPPTRRGGGLTLQFGSFAALDRLLSSPKTKSPVNILWRQLEFGTGVFAKTSPWFPNPPRKGELRPKGPKYEDGSWDFGPTHFLGSHPGNFLRQATGLEYGDDATLFADHFLRALHARLQGH